MKDKINDNMEDEKKFQLEDEVTLKCVLEDEEDIAENPLKKIEISEKTPLVLEEITKQEEKELDPKTLLTVEAEAPVNFIYDEKKKLSTPEFDATKEILENSLKESERKDQPFEFFQDQKSNPLHLEGVSKQLKIENTEVCSENNRLKKQVQVLQHDKDSILRELDEIKEELSYLEKKHQIKLNRTHGQIQVFHEGKEYYEKKSRELEGEFERLRYQIQVDVIQIKEKERKLEEQLEMTVTDSGLQLKARDDKILELKRKLDSIEFNLGNIVMKESKTMQEKKRIEGQLDHIVQIMRSSIESFDHQE